VKFVENIYEVISSIKEAFEKEDLVGLKKIIDETDPSVLVEVLNTMDSELRAKIVPYVDLIKVSKHISKLSDEAIIEIENYKGLDEIVELLYWLPSDEAVDFLQKLSPKTIAKILKTISPSKAKELRELLKYSPESVGGVMTSRIPVFTKGMKIADVLEEFVKKIKIGYYDTYNYIYIVDNDGKLIGWIDAKQTFIANRDKFVESYATNPLATVYPEADREEAARLAVKYDMIEIPVVDREGRLLGAVTIDDVLDIAIHELSEDLLKHGGLLEPIRLSYTSSTVKKLVVNRAVPLVILYVMNTIVGSIVAAFTHIIEKVAVLAAFLPMLADNSGNVGSQASTIIIRSLALGELSTKHVKYILMKEIALSLAMACILLPIAMLISFSITFLAYRNVYYALKIGTIVISALLVSVLISDIVGSMLPLLLLKIKQDPASASAPLITTIADITTSITYFTVATVMLGF